MSELNWIQRYPDSPPVSSEVGDWAEQLEISPFIAKLLWQRGLHTKDEMSFFINPGLRYLAALELWPGLEQASEILFNGLKSGKKLVVWGDYDVDGITSTALAVSFLKEHGFEAGYYIPRRLEDGYSLNVSSLEALAAEGYDMLLTVDCGISDIHEVARARELGFTVVISDHHLPGDELPDAHAICAPTIAECPCPYLAGVGVCFMLMAGLNAKFAEAGHKKLDIRKFLDLVALGTLADVVNINGQNRILVKNGLLSISAGERLGIAALKAICKINPMAAVSAWQVVFTIAPRINAAGRMGESDLALKLLLTEDRLEAAEIADKLEALNRARRAQEDEIAQAAKIQAMEQVQSGRMGLVVYAPDWHMGVIGIVASRLVEEFSRPAIVLCDNAQRIKGSGRSLDGFDLHGALENCSDLLLTFGGHRMAAGLSFKPDNLEVFREKFDREVKAVIGDIPPPPRLKMDGEMSITGGTDFTVLKELELLQPFGMGNIEPVFISNPLILRNVQINKMVMIIDVYDEVSGITMKAKIWRPRKEFPTGSRGRKIRLAYSPRIDRYNGAANVEWRVKDWKLEN